jgi:hypothetical protein
VHDLGQVADVVDVAVRDHDRVGRRGRRRERDVVERLRRVRALEQPAVDVHVLAVAEREQVLAAGDGAGRADERELSHRSPP